MRYYDLLISSGMAILHDLKLQAVIYDMPVLGYMQPH